MNGSSEIEVTDVLQRTENMLIMLEGLAVKNPDQVMYFKMMAHGSLQMSRDILNYCYDYRTPTVVEAAYEVAHEWVSNSWGK